MTRVAPSPILPISAILPAATATSACRGCAPVPSTTVPFLISRSYAIGFPPFAGSWAAVPKRSPSRPPVSNAETVRRYALACRAEQPVELRVEARGEERIAARGEMQPVGRDCYGQLSVAVQQHIADIGIKDVPAIGAVADEMVDLGGCDAELSRGRFLPRQ